MFTECNNLLHPQLNSKLLTNSGDLAVLARNGSRHFALASGQVLNSFPRREQGKGFLAGAPFKNVQIFEHKSLHACYHSFLGLPSCFFLPSLPVPMSHLGYRNWES